jgi:hypothetical protein
MSVLERVPVRNWLNFRRFSEQKSVILGRISLAISGKDPLERNELRERGKMLCRMSR